MTYIVEIHPDGKTQAIQQRKKIVWLENPMKFRYLREGELNNGRYEQAGVKSHLCEFGKLVGYEIITDRNPEIVYRDHQDGRTYHHKLDYLEKFDRRFWWLKKHDRDIKPEGCYKYLVPIEAVVPGSISLFKTSQSYKKSKYLSEDLARMERDGDPRFVSGKWVCKQKSSGIEGCH